MEAAEFFEEIWQKFPKRPGAVRETAWKAFQTIAKTEWPLLDAAVSHQRKLFDAECAARGEDEEQRAHFAPFMGNWLGSGVWRELGVTAPVIAPDDTVDLVVAGPGEPEYEAVAKLRRKRPIVGKSGKCTFRRAEVEDAMRGAA